MTTVINNPTQPTEGTGNSGNTGNMVAILVLVLLVILFFVYGLPAMQRGGTGNQDTQNMQTDIIQEQPDATSPVESPEPTSGPVEIDLNINETSPEPEPTEEVMVTTEPSPTE